jgi:DNA repair protein RecO (recombination protein O)
MALMAKGARRIKSRLKGVLQPFQPVLLSWTGKGEVPTLTSAEIDQSEYSFLHHELQGDGLVCGFYCNELLVKLLHRHDPHSKLFDCYHATVMGLNSAHENDNLANALRAFEHAVIRETGYEVSFVFESDGKTLIDEAGCYRFQTGQGFVKLANMQSDALSGRAIRSMVSEEQHRYSHEEIAQGKYLMRDILSNIMGRQKIVSRGLFFPKTRN